MVAGLRDRQNSVDNGAYQGVSGVKRQGVVWHHPCCINIHCNIENVKADDADHYFSRAGLKHLALWRRVVYAVIVNGVKGENQRGNPEYDRRRCDPP